MTELLAGCRLPGGPEKGGPWWKGPLWVLPLTGVLAVTLMFVGEGDVPYELLESVNSLFVTFAGLYALLAASIAGMIQLTKENSVPNVFRFVRFMPLVGVLFYGMLFQSLAIPLSLTKIPERCVIWLAYAFFWVNAGLMFAIAKWLFTWTNPYRAIETLMTSYFFTRRTDLLRYRFMGKVAEGDLIDTLRLFSEKKNDRAFDWLLLCVKSDKLGMSPDANSKKRESLYDYLQNLLNDDRVKSSPECLRSLEKFFKKIPAGN